MSRESSTLIVKNTTMLYIRTLVVMLVTLYTARIVLKSLGEIDFGIYSLIASFVIFFYFITSTLTTAIQRYVNIEVGKGNIEDINRVFSVCLVVVLIMSLVILLLAECIGLWMLHNVLEVPIDRMNIANWVLHFSVLNCVICLCQIPYQVTIISYEKMSFFAIIGLVEAFSKLVIAFLIGHTPVDRLFLYSLLITFVQLIIYIIYKIYCHRSFVVTHFQFVKDKILYKNILSFSGWTILSSASDVATSQGINMIFNVFYGVTINAATGIASRVTDAMYQFVSNFQTAFKPQIFNNWANNNIKELLSLVYRSSKLSYFLMLCMTLPFIINNSFILGVWLDEVPQCSDAFIFWILLYLTVSSLSSPFWYAIQATGKVAWYFSAMSLTTLLNLPLAYLLLSKKMPPETVFIIRFIINLIQHFIRVGFANKLLDLNICEYFKHSLLPIVYVTILSIPIPTLLGCCLDGWWRLILTTLTSIAVIGVCSYYVGFNKDEREFAKTLVMKKLKGI